MTGGGLLILLGVSRMLDYLGFAVFAGVLSAPALGLIPRADRTTLPRTHRERLLRLQRAGLIVLTAGTVLNLVGAAGLIALGRTGAPVDLIGAAALARLAVLAAAVLLLPDPGRIRTPAARFAVLLVVGVLVLTLVVAGPLIRGPHWAVGAATAAWQLAGLAALTGAVLVLLTARTSAPEVARQRARLVLRIGSVVIGVAAVAGLLAALVTSAGAASALVSVVGLAVTLVLILSGARAAETVGTVTAGSTTPAAGPSGSRSAGSVLLSTGLAVGAVVLIISSWLPQQIL